MDYINGNIIAIGCVFLSLHCTVDYKMIMYRESKRWFVNHVISNFFIVSITLEDMFRLLSCTDGCGELVQRGGGIFPYYQGKEGEITPSEMIVGITGALHLYHLLVFENLRTIDYMHHYLMLIVLVMSYLFQAACYQSMFMFFLSGLPGLIDYGMLALGVNRKTEKRINVYLNNYLRAPGIIFTMGLYWRDIRKVSGLISLIVGYGLLYWNATYFNLDVTRSYYSYISV